jgi:HAE1 family hydrophobic/amphiphilic exporter-1
MTLSDLSIKNPVFAVMLSAAMVVFGYMGYRDLGISQFPEIDFPVVSITTYREQAAPETMDFDVTDFIEDAVSGVEGIDYIQSQSLEGVAVTMVYFHLSRDIDVAMQDVQNAVSAAAHRLPNDIDPPIISKVNFNKFPVIWLSIHGHKPLQELNRFVDDYLKQQIETIPGCGGVMYGGLRSRTMRVWLDADKLQSYNLDALDVMRALRAEHVEKPAGYIMSKLRELNVRVMGEARTPQEFAQMPIITRDNQVVRLGDVAVIEDGLADRRAFARFNGEPNVGVGVMRATGANVVQVCDDVKRRLPALQKMAPPGVEVGISTDYSMFIRDDIDEVNQSLLFGIILTAVVTFVFLGSLGTTFNVCISIPTSLIGTFVALKFFGFTVNFMTLLALSLSVGVVVDDAILVLENIYRRCELGEKRREASLRGAREISFAAIAATLSIAAIFIPVAFMKGAIGRFFFQFGITCTVAVMLSLVISLTITPMLCSLFLTVRHMNRRCPGAYRGLFGPILTLLTRIHWLIDRWVLEPIFVLPMNRLMEAMARWYGRVLRLAVHHQWWVVPASLLLAATALLFVFGLTIRFPGWFAGLVGQERLVIKPIGRELVPSEDQNRFIVYIKCPVGSSIDYVDEMLQKGEKVLADLKDPVTGKDVTATMFAAVSIRPGTLLSEGLLFVRLVPAHERSWTQTDCINEVRQRLKDVAGCRAVALDLSTQGFTPSRGYPVNFAIQGPDWDTVTILSERIKERMIDSGVVTDVDTDFRPGMPEVHVVPDRLKASELGIPVQRLAFTLNVAFGGVRNGRFTDQDKRYDVRVRTQEQHRESPDQLQYLYVKTDNNKLVPLSDLAESKMVSTLPMINRYNHLRKVELTANMAPGVSQGEAIVRSHEIAEEVRDQIVLPDPKEAPWTAAMLGLLVAPQGQGPFLAASVLSTHPEPTIGLPPSYRIVEMGNSSALNETLNSMWAALALGFVVASMILGVQFNSFVHPFTVLLAVPFGVTGALAMLWMAGDTLNLMSMIGMVLLAGLVKKNSIILVDYTNQLRAQGMGLEEAVLTACPIRLRPILMTSLACIASAIPLAMGYGPGAETRAPLARSIIGGIFLSTLVTLVIVPIFYMLFDRFGAWVQVLTRRKSKPEAIEPHPTHGYAGPHGSGEQPAANGHAADKVPATLEPVLEARPEPAT